MIRYGLIAGVLILFVLGGCSRPQEQTSGPSLAATSHSAAGTVAAGYSNPFAYCRAVGTIDRPDARYTGPQPPPAVIAGLARAFGAPPATTAAPTFARGSFWRCMDAKVYACNVGANLPCEQKANTSRTPTAGENDYCAENHDALFIPMYVSGHDTVYDWSCRGGRAVAGKTLSAVDKRGYLANIWYPIPAPSTDPH